MSEHEMVNAGWCQEMVADTVENLWQRLRHLQLAMDALVRDADLYRGERIQRVALIGHSLVAYTALALAGGTPRTTGGLAGRADGGNFDTAFRQRVVPAGPC